MSPPSAMTMLRALALAVGFALTSPAWAAAPAAKVPAPAPTPEQQLQQAQQCYAQADLGCALRVLEPEAAWPPSLPIELRSERLRLWAFAAARLDRHPEARKVFATWIALQPGNRLDRAATPPTIFADYAAAWVDVLGPQLDREPQLAEHPPLDAPRPTAVDLPRFAPPPLAGRDQARDHRFYLGATLNAAGSDLPSSPTNQLGLQMAMALDLSHLLSLGINLQAVRWTMGDGPATRALAQVEGGLQLPWVAPDLQAIADAGFAFDYDAQAVAALGVGLRYHVAPERPVGLYVSLQDQMAIGSQVVHVGVLAIGAALHPAVAAGK